MAANLTNIMWQVLTGLFPSPHLPQSRRDSVYTALVWGGLEETPSFLTRSDSVFIYGMNNMARDTSIRVPFDIFNNGILIGTHSDYDSHNLSLLKHCP